MQISFSKTAILVTTAMITCLGSTAATFAAPNLGDGIFCVSKGKTESKNLYYYTSEITDKTIEKKEPISVTLVEKQVDVTTDALVVIDKKAKTVTVSELVGESVSPPTDNPVALAKLTPVGLNEFKGKDKTGAEITLKLEDQYSLAKLTHAGKIYPGVCR
ncbi:MAG: hypothetical protein WCA35_01255 [Kovacikia sp.]